LSELSAYLTNFSRQQAVFFVGIAAPDARVTISPKGMDSLRVLELTEMAWLNVTGSGNKTAARMVQPGDGSVGAGRPLPSARQAFVLDINLIQTSCGLAVPLLDFCAERDELNTWAAAKSAEGLHTYPQEKNSLSIDDFSTGLPQPPQLDWACAWTGDSRAVLDILAGAA